MGQKNRPSGAIFVVVALARGDAVKPDDVAVGGGHEVLLHFVAPVSDQFGLK